MTEHETEDDSEFVTKYDLKIYDYESKEYIKTELHDFEVQMLSVMTGKLENISMEIGNIKTLLIEMLIGIIGSIILLFISALFFGVV